jgi:hypothetical protein
MNGSEFLDVVLNQGLDCIVRAADARSFSADDQALFEAVARQPVQERFTLSLKRRPDVEPRVTQVELHFGSLILKRPKRAENQRARLTLSVVNVREPQPPLGEEAVHGLLLASLPVETPGQARQTPEAPCNVVLRPVEGYVLFAFIHRTQRLPETPPSLHQVVRWIGRPGGFLGRKGDGEPGVRVLWRGWQHLQDIAATWSITFPLPTPWVIPNQMRRGARGAVSSLKNRSFLLTFTRQSFIYSLHLRPQAAPDFPQFDGLREVSIKGRSEQMFLQIDPG